MTGLTRKNLVETYKQLIQELDKYKNNNTPFTPKIYIPPETPQLEELEKMRAKYENPFFSPYRNYEDALSTRENYKEVKGSTPQELLASDLQDIYGDISLAKPAESQDLNTGNLNINPSDVYHATTPLEEKLKQFRAHKTVTGQNISHKLRDEHLKGAPKTERFSQDLGRRYQMLDTKNLDLLKEIADKKQARREQKVEKQKNRYGNELQYLSNLKEMKDADMRQPDTLNTKAYDKAEKIKNKLEMLIANSENGGQKISPEIIDSAYKEAQREIMLLSNNAYKAFPFEDKEGKILAAYLYPSKEGEEIIEKKEEPKKEYIKIKKALADIVGAKGELENVDNNLLKRGHGPSFSNKVRTQLNQEGKFIQEEAMREIHKKLHDLEWEYLGGRKAKGSTYEGKKAKIIEDGYLNLQQQIQKLMADSANSAFTDYEIDKTNILNRGLQLAEAKYKEKGDMMKADTLNDDLLRIHKMKNLSDTKEALDQHILLHHQKFPEDRTSIAPMLRSVNTNNFEKLDKNSQEAKIANEKMIQEHKMSYEQTKAKAIKEKAERKKQKEHGLFDNIVQGWEMVKNKLKDEAEAKKRRQQEMQIPQDPVLAEEQIPMLEEVRRNPEQELQEEFKTAVEDYDKNYIEKYVLPAGKNRYGNSDMFESYDKFIKHPNALRYLKDGLWNYIRAYALQEPLKQIGAPSYNPPTL